MNQPVLQTKKKWWPKAAHIISGAAFWLTTALTAGITIFILYKGASALNWEFLTTSPSYLSDHIGIWPDIVNTLVLLCTALPIVLVCGVGGAVYLNEYCTSAKLKHVIEYASDILSGIPSIIYGLVGMLFFCEFLGFRTSLLAGALTLAMMNLPTLLRTTQESLQTVPSMWKQGSAGLGAGKWRTIYTIVLPSCLDGILTGCILAAGRILGESAALLFTAGFAHTLYSSLVKTLSGPGASLSTALYIYARENGEFSIAFAIAAVLMILCIGVQLLAGSVNKIVKKGRTA